ncbi:hypothetical protein Hanom_Chr14g01276181 [Helianthus anomalus]
MYKRRAPHLRLRSNFSLKSVPHLRLLYTLRLMSVCHTKRFGLRLRSHCA